MRSFVLLAALLAALPAGAVDLEYVAVRAPGNPTDDTGHGVVGYDFAISRYEVTNAQYAAFRNVWEWNDSANGTDRGLRGGSWASLADSLAASSPNGNFPSTDGSNIGFRVARTVPEARRTGALVLAGVRRRRAVAPSGPRGGAAAIPRSR